MTTTSSFEDLLQQYEERYKHDTKTTQSLNLWRQRVFGDEPTPSCPLKKKQEENSDRVELDACELLKTLSAAVTSVTSSLSSCEVPQSNLAIETNNSPNSSNDNHTNHETDTNAKCDIVSQEKVNSSSQAITEQLKQCQTFEEKKAKLIEFLRIAAEKRKSSSTTELFDEEYQSPSMVFGNQHHVDDDETSSACSTSSKEMEQHESSVCEHEIENTYDPSRDPMQFDSYMSRQDMEKNIRYLLSQISQVHECLQIVRRDEQLIMDQLHFLKEILGVDDKEISYTLTALPPLEKPPVPPTLLSVPDNEEKDKHLDLLTFEEEENQVQVADGMEDNIHTEKEVVVVEATVDKEVSEEPSIHFDHYDVTNPFQSKFSNLLKKSSSLF